MLTDAKIRKIKPLEKKTKYPDEKGMYLEVNPSRLPSGRGISILEQSFEPKWPNPNRSSI